LILPNNGQSACSQMPEWCLRFGIVRLSKKHPKIDLVDHASRLAYTEHVLSIGTTGGLDRVGVAPAQVMERAHQALIDRTTRCNSRIAILQDQPILSRRLLMPRQ
jgi:hypothetical protein